MVTFYKDPEAQSWSPDCPKSVSSWSCCPAQGTKQSKGGQGRVVSANRLGQALSPRWSVQVKEEAGRLGQEGQGPGPQGAGGVEEGREEAGESRGGQVESSRALRVGAIGVSNHLAAVCTAQGTQGGGRVAMATTILQAGGEARGAPWAECTGR